MMFNILNMLGQVKACPAILAHSDRGCPSHGLTISLDYIGLLVQPSAGKGPKLMPPRYLIVIALGPLWVLAWSGHNPSGCGRDIGAC